MPTGGSVVSGYGAMIHIANKVRAEKFDEYYQRLVDKHVEVTPILNHDNSPTQSSAEMNDDVYVRSVYFFDPDGVCLEFAAWTRALDERDIAHDPVRRSEEHTSELQSLMRISYAVFCLKKKKTNTNTNDKHRESPCLT